ncbi:MAG: pilin [Patescibacteria group bacterium]
MKEFFLAQFINIWQNTGAGGITCNIKGPCDFCDAVVVASNIVKFLFQVSIPIAVIMMVYGAIILMFAAGSEERFATGKKIITSAVIGLSIALVAWVIIGTLLHVLTGNPDYPWASITCS